MKTTVKEAKATTIYTVENYNEVYQKNFFGINENGERVFFHDKNEIHNYKNVKQLSSQLLSCDYRICETNLYDFVMQSAEETTSPRGVECKLHIRQDGICINSEYDADENVEVWTWGVKGNNPHCIESFETLEEAEDYIFQQTYKYDFANEVNFNTFFTETKEEAEEYIYEHISEDYGVSTEVAKSIYKHSLLAEELRQKRQLNRTIKASEEKQKLIEEAQKQVDKLVRSTNI